jgi:bacteriocin-like protein
MYELNEEELKQVAGGYTGYTGFGAGVGAASFNGWGHAYLNSGAGSYTTPSGAYGYGSNTVYGGGYQPFLLSGAAANTTYTHS